MFNILKLSALQNTEINFLKTYHMDDVTHDQLTSVLIRMSMQNHVTKPPTRLKVKTYAKNF